MSPGWQDRGLIPPLSEHTLPPFFLPKYMPAYDFYNAWDSKEDGAFDNLT